MKKIFLYSLLFILASSVYTENIKPNLSEMSEQELIDLFIKNHKKIKKYKKEVAEAKAETESAKKVNEKLDEILGVLEKDKK